MISRRSTATCLVAATLFSISAAFAQTSAAPAPTAAPAAAVAPKAMPVNATPSAPVAPAAKGEKQATAKPGNTNKQFTAKTAKSKECSLKADEKKLKGKARQKFRAECKKAA